MMAGQAQIFEIPCRCPTPLRRANRQLQDQPGYRLLVTSIDDNPSNKFVEVGLGLLTLDGGREGVDGLISAEHGGVPHGVVSLEVGLAVKARCGDIAGPISAAGGQEYQVTGEGLICFHFYYVSNLDFFTLFPHLLCILHNKDVAFVHLVVSSVPQPVLVPLRHRHRQHKPLTK